MKRFLVGVFPLLLVLMGTMSAAVPNISGISTSYGPLSASVRSGGITYGANAVAYGPVGTSTVIRGSNFGSSGTVVFDGSGGNTVSVGYSTLDPSIVAVIVPSGATTGNVVITTGGQSSNGVLFMVTSGTSPATCSAPLVVSIAPATATLGQSQAQQFAATVTNTPNTAVTWSISPAGIGSINSSGLYLAPATISTQQTVTIIATSAANTTKTASATITLTPSIAVSITPSTATLGQSQTQQFTATVANTSNSAVTWSIIPSGTGTISAAGLYAAPSTISTQQTVTITATSAADTSKTGSVTVTLTPPIAVSITPPAATLGQSQTQQFTATVANTSNTAVTWSISPAATGSISNTGLYTAPGTISTQQIVTIAATSAADATKTASATITLTPPIVVSITPATATLGQNQTQQFTATVANTSNTTVTGSVSPSGVGTISTAGLYTVPAAISTQQTVTVIATSVADSTKSASAAVMLSPPVPPTISTLTPSSGKAGISVTIAGSNFTSTAGTVTFNGQPASISSWSDTSIVVIVPNGVSSGNVVVTVGGLQSSGGAFTVTPGVISSLTPGSGITGSQVAIAGSGFNQTQGSGIVTFNGIAGLVTNWSDASITVLVPSGASTGPVLVTASGAAASNPVNFSVVPVATSLYPSFGAVGSVVTIGGSGFGASQGPGGHFQWNGNSGQFVEQLSHNVLCSERVGGRECNCVCRGIWGPGRESTVFYGHAGYQ